MNGRSSPIAARRGRIHPPATGRTWPSIAGVPAGASSRSRSSRRPTPAALTVSRYADALVHADQPLRPRTPAICRPRPPGVTVPSHGSISSWASPSMPSSARQVHHQCPTPRRARDQPQTCGFPDRVAVVADHGRPPSGPQVPSEPPVVTEQSASGQAAAPLHRLRRCPPSMRLPSAVTSAAETHPGQGQQIVDVALIVAPAGPAACSSPTSGPWPPARRFSGHVADGEAVGHHVAGEEQRAWRTERIEDAGPDRLLIGHPCDHLTTGEDDAECGSSEIIRVRGVRRSSGSVGETGDGSVVRRSLLRPAPRSSSSRKPETRSIPAAVAQGLLGSSAS